MTPHTRKWLKVEIDARARPVTDVCLIVFFIFMIEIQGVADFGSHSIFSVWQAIELIRSVFRGFFDVVGLFRIGMNDHVLHCLWCRTLDIVVSPDWLRVRDRSENSACSLFG